MSGECIFVLCIFFGIFQSISFAVCSSHREAITVLEKRIEDLEKYIYDEE